MGAVKVGSRDSCKPTHKDSVRKITTSRSGSPRVRGRQSALVMKNWEPLVPGPALAIERSPGLVCLRAKFSSANLAP